MENLKSFEKDDVPDLGQDYWMQVGRMERCKGLGLPRMLGVSTALSAFSYLLAHAAIWADSLVIVDASGIVVSHLTILVAILSGIGCIAAGATALGVGIYGIVDAFQLRSWRRALPPRPENYSEEMAKKAYHLDYKVSAYNSLLAKTESALEDLHIMHSEIEHSFDFTQNYLEAMSEDDVEVLTLREENPSC